MCSLAKSKSGFEIPENGLDRGFLFPEPCKCGEVLISLQAPALIVNCLFCPFRIESLEKFSQHIKSKHLSKLAASVCRSFLSKATQPPKIRREEVELCKKKDIIVPALADSEDSFSSAEKHINTYPERNESNDELVTAKGQYFFHNSEQRSPTKHNQLEEANNNLVNSQNNEDAVSEKDLKDLSKGNADLGQNHKLEEVGEQHVYRIIQLLREHPVLWDTKLHSYYNRRHRQQAFESITNAMLVEYPNLNIDDKYIMIKIRSLKFRFYKYYETLKHTKIQDKLCELLHFLGERPCKKEEVFCSQCNTEVDSLARHLITHHQDTRGKDTKERICEYCGRQFIGDNNLRAHRKAVHLQLRPYSCNICFQTFKSTQLLKTHRNSRHLNIRTHQCDVCSKAFYDRKTMIQHKRLHSDEMNYECRICGKKFRQASGLYSHMKTHQLRNEPKL